MGNISLCGSLYNRNLIPSVFDLYFQRKCVNNLEASKQMYGSGRKINEDFL